SCSLYFIQSDVYILDLHSFPTRRSSDLVCIADRDESAGKRTAEFIRKRGGEAEFIRCDVSSRTQVAKAVRLAAEAGGRIDILCKDRKSTRLNSSHRTISYAVFCLKKKKM